MNTNSNSLNWFEIPVKDIDRAQKFYEAVFDITMERKATGAIVQSNMHIPSHEGSIIYLNANPKLELALGKIEAAGGKIVIPKTQITEEYGHMAFSMIPKEIN